MLNQQTRNKIGCCVPEINSEDEVQKFNIVEKDKIKDFYSKNGFVVIKSLFDINICQQFRDAWDKEVKKYKGKIYRQTNAKLEKNFFNQQGWVMNPILNLQSLDERKLPRLRSYFDLNIADNKKLSELLEKLIGEKAKIVQSMYFEGNSATWEHQDSYYLDDEEIGTMVAGWIALEDIAADAGRFFVCPKSHLEDYSEMNKDNVISDFHEKYIESIVNLIKSKNLKIVAPKLDKGDILLWNSLTIHGSLNSQSKVNSRSSITFHAIRTSSNFLILRNILKKCKPEMNYEIHLFRPKDMNRFRNRIIYFFESKSPKTFYKIKDFTIRFLINNFSRKTKFR